MNMLAFVGADLLVCSRQGEKRATKLAQDVKREGWDVHRRRHCPFHETKGMLLKRYLLERGTEQWEPSTLPIGNLIGSVSLQIVPNAAE